MKRTDTRVCIGGGLYHAENSVNVERFWFSRTTRGKCTVEYVNCLSCVAEYKADCIAHLLNGANAAHGMVYPAECVGAGATCTDGLQNRDETDVDCGGTICPACGAGLGCSVAGDCASGVCTGGTCQVPTCTDGVQNGTETSPDCGGPACVPCAVCCEVAGGPFAACGWTLDDGGVECAVLAAPFGGGVTGTTYLDATCNAATGLCETTPPPVASPDGTCCAVTPPGTGLGEGCFSGSLGVLPGTDCVSDLGGTPSNGTCLPDGGCRPCATVSETFCDQEGDQTIYDAATGLEWEQKDGADGVPVVGNLHDVDNRYTWAGQCAISGRLCQPSVATAALCQTQTDDAIEQVGGCTVCLNIPGVEGPCNVDPWGFGALDTVWGWLAAVNAEGGTGFAGHADWRLPTVAGIDPDSTGEAAELESILLEPFPCITNPCIDTIFRSTNLSSITCAAPSWRRRPAGGAFPPSR